MTWRVDHPSSTAAISRPPSSLICSLTVPKVHSRASQRIAAYLTAGLGTTAGSLGNTMKQFVDNPDQWALMRDDPSPIPTTILEGVLIASVVQWFTRVTTRDDELDDILIPEGTRVLHSYAAGNTDERY